jgi:hypothetical protein
VVFGLAGVFAALGLVGAATVLRALVAALG